MIGHQLLLLSIKVETLMRWQVKFRKSGMNERIPYFNLTFLFPFPPKAVIIRNSHCWLSIVRNTFTMRIYDEALYLWLSVFL